MGLIIKNNAFEASTKNEEPLFLVEKRFLTVLKTFKATFYSKKLSVAMMNRKLPEKSLT